MQSYYELPLYLLSGLLGSGHCVGMCGGFVMAIGLHDRSSTKALLKQSAYTLGRCLTYTLLGATLGGLGKRFAQQLEFMGSAGAVLAVVAGVFIFYLGVVGLTGFSLAQQFQRRWSKNSPKSTCTTASLFAVALKQSTHGATGALLAGIATGFLPCGLLYGMLSIAAASQSVTRGAALMLIFGIGTSPALITLGVFGRSIKTSWRGGLYKLAAISLLVAGALTCIRGVYALEQIGASDKGPACPLCAKP